LGWLASRQLIPTYKRKEKITRKRKGKRKRNRKRRFEFEKGVHVSWIGVPHVGRYPHTQGEKKNKKRKKSGKKETGKGSLNWKGVCMCLGLACLASADTHLHNI